MRRTLFFLSPSPLPPAPHACRERETFYPEDTGNMRHEETPAERKRRKLLFALRLRRRMTQAEEILWQALRRQALHGLKFRRQVPIGRFIVDFLCMQRMLIIEVDGPIHDEQQEYDLEREAYLRSLGFKILRLKNHNVMKNLPGTLNTIHRAATAPLGVTPQKEDPSPSPGVENGVVGEGAGRGYEKRRRHTVGH